MAQPLETLLSATRTSALADEVKMRELMVALLAVTHIPQQRGDIAVADLFLCNEALPPLPAKKYEDLLDMVTACRSLQLESQLSDLLRTGAIRIDDLKKLTRNSAIKKYLAELGKVQRD